MQGWGLFGAYLTAILLTNKQGWGCFGAYKGVACWGAARLCGADNRTAMGIGALMNARGLMELIIINIGLQAGVIGPALFSMMVLMAIITTLMASPLFEMVYGKKARESGELEAIGAEAKPQPI